MCTLLAAPDAPAQWTENAVALYLAAFPASERRTADEWRRQLRRGHPFRLLLIARERSFAGFISLWDFADFTYVEHFAVCEATRGGGIGGTAIDTLRCQRPRLVLEVEPPADEMARRRIGFYRRHGFCPSERPYLQPPYCQGGEWLRLMLMTTEPAFLEQEFERVKATIHRNVYGIQPAD